MGARRRKVTEKVLSKDKLDLLLQLLSQEEKQELLRRLQHKDELSIPVCLFHSKRSGLETIVLYLKDSAGMSVKKIAQFLNRKSTTIYTSYHHAKKKDATLSISVPLPSIPLSLFAQRDHSVLEIIVIALKQQGYSLAKIALLLGKASSTIRTVHWRCTREVSR